MKKAYFLLLFMFAVSFIFVSCSEDDGEIYSLTLSEHTVNMYSKGTVSVTISKGNGEYTATSSDDKIAEVSIKDNIVLIKGNKTGKATITINDKENKTAKIDVELYEEVFRYSVTDADVYYAEGVDENIIEAVEGEISTFYVAEIGGVYQFLRNDIYTGELYVYPAGATSYLYTGVFTAAKHMIRLDVKEPEKTITYNAIKVEPVKSSEVSAPFSFDDKIALVLDVTEYYKQKYPEATIGKIAVAQYLERIDAQ
ncbi:MAG: Ig-like domain-containing protein [Dysgonomonas sp.]